MKNLLNSLLIITTSLAALYFAHQYLEGQLLNLFDCAWIAFWLVTLHQSIKLVDGNKRRKVSEVKETVVTNKQLSLYGKEAGYDWRDVRRSS